MRDDWIRYRDLFEGKHNVLVKPEYLWYHAIELKALANKQADEIRQSRETRTRYLNLVEAIASLWQSYFFRSEPTIDENTKKLLGKAEDDIDGKGTSLFSFIRDQVLISYLIYGKVIVSVDTFSKTGRNRAEQKELGIRPYLELHSPLSVKDWQTETEDTSRIGKLNFLRTEYDLIAPRSYTSEPILQRYSQVLERSQSGYQVSTFTTAIDNNLNYVKLDPTTKEAIWESVGTPIVSPKINEIPVSIIDSKPWLHDVCEEVLRYYNLRSNYDNVNYYQGYADKYIKGVTNQDQMKAFSEYVVKFLPSDGDAIQIDPVDTSSLRDATAESLNNVFKIGLNMFRALPQDAKGVQGADTIQEDKDNTYAIVESSLDDIEVLINDAIRNYSILAGTPIEPQIQLCRDIKRDNWNEFIQINNAFREEINQMPMVKQAVLRRAIAKMDLDNENEKDIKSEIDSYRAQNPDQQLAQERQNIITNALNGK